MFKKQNKLKEMQYTLDGSSDKEFRNTINVFRVFYFKRGMLTF